MGRQFASGLVAALALIPALALGQSYPSRPVRMIIPFAPGGASDFVGRIMQPRVSEVVDVPGVLIANASFAPNTVKELVDYARAHPGNLNYGSPGSGSQNRLEMELFRQAAGGLDMVHIPYKGGAGPAVTGLMTGETHLMFTTAPSALGFIKGGRLKVLAVTSAKRVAALPDVPTMVESGFPRSVTGSWQGVFVHTGTPQHALPAPS